MGDEELMARYIAGDDSAFGILYQKYSGRAYAYLRKKLKSSEEVEEVFQASFLKFHRLRARYDSKYAVLQWLFVIIRSTLIDHCRKNSRQVNVTDTPIESFSETMSQSIDNSALTSERVDDLLGQLQKDHREVVVRKVIDEQTYEEIASTLQRSEASVRQTVSRALRRMKANRMSKEGRS